MEIRELFGRKNDAEIIYMGHFSHFSAKGIYNNVPKGTFASWKFLIKHAAFQRETKEYVALLLLPLRIGVLVRDCGICHCD